jgi:3-oxoacyl-[acyl-carrier protein] reductase
VSQRDAGTQAIRIPTYPDLAGKVALVTGGSRGIGAATSLLLAKNGVRVAVNGRDEAAIGSVAREIRDGGGDAIPCPADCTDMRAIDRMRESVERAFGPVDIICAFAGAGSPIPTETLTEETWRNVVDTNLTATFLTIKSCLSGMIERRRGAIVTMSSSAGRLPGRASVAYAAAKAGIVMMTGHLANELGKHNVRVNCIAPSAILTERNRQQIPEAQQRELAASFPLGRIGTPEDVGLAALYLVSDCSSWVTGVTLDVAGGRIIV